MSDSNLMGKITSLAKRRGFVFQSSEIYGGAGSVWDFGPLGNELKRNVKEQWWNSMVHRRDDVEGLDSSILMNPKVWEASGHLDGFTDPLVECSNCNRRFRDDTPGVDEGQCPTCGKKEVFGEPRMFNLMFKTFMGPVEDEASTVFLRPETAQGAYVNFINVHNSARQKIPFGIAQIGKAFRNEITPGNFIFRTREFEQMEMQYFVKPGDDDQSMKDWKFERLKFYDQLGINSKKLRFHEHGPNELAHYAKEAWDIEFEFSFGWSEIEGIHNRTDYDLSRHQEFSGKKMEIFDQQNNDRFLPFIIETSAGLNRMMLAVLSDAYWNDEENNRVVMKLHPRIAPVTAVVCPLVKKDGLPELGRKVMDILKPHFKVIYDQQGSIGKRYYRQDEAGTPYGITLDHQSIDDKTVTLRDRDTQVQNRISIDNLVNAINDSIESYS